LITQRVFIAEACAWVRWKGIIIEQNSKNKKNSNNNKKNWFRWLEVEWIKIQIFLNLKKLPMNNNYMM
jgi:GTPase SAR1 family protein